MSLLFKVRDTFVPRSRVLQEVGLKPGHAVLDYGCGPGGYIVGVAERVGASGRIYALDASPLALRQVKRIAEENRLTNVRTILSDCDTGLPDESVDVALFYDVFHGLGEPDRVLAELFRVLRPEGVLSFSDHHLKRQEIPAKVSSSGLFRLSGKAKKTHTFAKVDS